MQRCCATRDVCHCGTCSHVKRLCLSSCAEQLLQFPKSQQVARLSAMAWTCIGSLTCFMFLSGVVMV